MTLEQLKDQLSFLFTNQEPISLSLYFVLEIDSVETIKYADIVQEISNELLSQFKAYIDSKLMSNESLIYGNLSEAEDKRNSAYFYDLEQKPHQLQWLEILINNEEQEKFNFNEDNLGSIKGFVLLIGNENKKISIYKKHYPINYIKQDSVLRIIPSKTRFEKLSTNIISINQSFEFLQINSNLIVLSTKVLEKHFGYEQIIRNASEANLTLIQNSELLEDIEPLRTLSCEMKYVRRIVRIKNDSPVLNLPRQTVMTFILNHPVLNRKIRLNADQTKVKLDTKVSQELFIKILNDDFLKSELTQLLYDSQSKDNMQIEEDLP